MAKKNKSKAYLVPVETKPSNTVKNAAASAQAYANGAKGGPLGMIGTALAGIAQAAAQRQAQTQTQTPTVQTQATQTPTVPIVSEPKYETPSLPASTTYQETYTPITPTVIDPYTASQEVIDAKARYDKYLNGEGKPTYSSKYADTIAALADKIANREDFSYDFNADPLYQNYKDQYTRQAMLANQNAVGQAAALTGGYSNSYATTAGALAYQDQMSKLNDVIPELYNAAYNKYMNDIQGQRQDLSMYQGLEDTDYGRYRDQVSDWNADRDFYGNDYYKKSDIDYSRYRDKVGDTQWGDTFRQNENQYKHNYDSDQYWNKANYDYNKAVDDRNFNYNKYVDDRNFDYQREQDDRNFNYNQYINDRDYEYNRSKDERDYNYQLSRDAVADKQQQFENNMTKREWKLNKKVTLQNLKDRASGSSGRSGGGYRSSGSRSSGSTGIPQGAYSSLLKWRNGNEGQSVPAKNKLDEVVKKYNLTNGQADYLYKDWLGYGSFPEESVYVSEDSSATKDGSGMMVKSEHVDAYTKLMKRVENLRDKGYQIYSYADFVKNIPSDASLRQYASYEDYARAMVKQYKKK